MKKILLTLCAFSIFSSTSAGLWKRFSNPYSVSVEKRITEIGEEKNTKKKTKKYHELLKEIVEIKRFKLGFLKLAVDVQTDKKQEIFTVVKEKLLLLLNRLNQNIKKTERNIGESGSPEDVAKLKKVKKSYSDISADINKLIRKFKKLQITEAAFNKKITYILYVATMAAYVTYLYFEDVKMLDTKKATKKAFNDLNKTIKSIDKFPRHEQIIYTGNNPTLNETIKKYNDIYGIGLVLTEKQVKEFLSLAKKVLNAYNVERTKREKSHLETLGLDPGATKYEINKAYRKLSLECHPDKVSFLKNQSDEEKRKETTKKQQSLNEARDQLLIKFTPDKEPPSHEDIQSRIKIEGAPEGNDDEDDEYIEKVD